MAGLAMPRRPMPALVMRSRHAGIGLPLGLVVLLLVLVAIRAPNFFSSSGLGGAIIVAAPLILSSMALTPIAIAGRGGVDLSIGPLVGFINVTIVTWLYASGFSSPWMVFGFAIAVGCLWQAAMALMIIKVRVSPIIVSLAGYLILQGVNLLILPRPGGEAPDWLSDWGYGTAIVSPVLGVLVVVAVVWWAFSVSPIFQAIRLTGADERMAYSCGIDTATARLVAHLAAGVLAAVAAVCLTGLIGSGDPTQGNTLTLQAVTALVLGGTSLAGGRGGALGSALGAIAMYLIFVVLSSFNFGALSGFITQAAFGLILVVTLTASTFRRIKTS